MTVLGIVFRKLNPHFRDGNYSLVNFGKSLQIFPRFSVILRFNERLMNENPNTSEKIFINKQQLQFYCKLVILHFVFAKQAGAVGGERIKSLVVFV